MTLKNGDSFLPRVISFFNKKADAKFWEEHWSRFRRAPNYRSGGLAQFESPFRSFLSKRRLVLEAGCGRAQWVAGLHIRGYDVLGVDFAGATLGAAAEAAPELKLLAGDVTRLPFEDQSLGAYISLGVIEHDQSGPERFLEEAKRLLAPDGIAIFTVPYANLFRRLKYFWHGSVGPRDGEFYQYYYHEDIVRDYLARFGLEVIHFEPYNPAFTIARDFLDNSWTTNNRFRAWANASLFMRRIFSHNAVYVCRFKNFLSKSTNDPLSAYRYEDDAPVVSDLETLDQALATETGDGGDRIFVSLETDDDLARLAAHLVQESEQSIGRVFCVHVKSEARPFSTTADVKVHYRRPANEGAVYFLEVVGEPTNKGVAQQVYQGKPAGRRCLVLNAFGTDPVRQVDNFDRRTYARLRSLLEKEAPCTVSIKSHYRRPSLRKMLAEVGITEGAGNTDVVVIFADGGRTVEQAKKCEARRVLVVFRASSRTPNGLNFDKSDLCRPVEQLPVLSYLSAESKLHRRWRRRKVPSCRERRYADDRYRDSGWLRHSACELVILDIAKPD